MTDSPAHSSYALPPLPDDDPAGFAVLLDKVERERGFRCRSYKERCLRRRIAVRMRATGTHTYDAYARVLDEQAVEYDRLLSALTINVTRLFRDHDAWAALRDVVVPGLWALPDARLRVWSAGTASGEEAYSLAAVFQAYAASCGESAAGRVEILGTDVDGASLGAAAAGVYAEAAFDEVPPEVRARYFTPGFPARATPELRALVRLAHHDLLRDPTPPGPWHLIVCRNVIIYFDRDSQEALFDRFHAALAPGGVLFLGKVETLLGRARGRYVPVDHRQRLFGRT